MTSSSAFALATRQSENAGAALLTGAFASSMLPLVMIRVGLLTTLCMVYVSDLINNGGVTDFTSWHSFSAWIPLVVIVSVAVAAFFTSLAGRPLLREAFFET